MTSATHPTAPTRDAAMARRRRAAAIVCATVAAAGLAAPAAHARRERVDIYTARLTLELITNAKSHEDGWSQVDTTTAMTGTLHARTDGLTFVDGIPQQATTPFTALNATDLAMDQHASYRSPYGNDSGSCHATNTESRPMGTGLVGTSLGANAGDGSQQISITVASPEAVWIEKTCEGYLQYEKADPLMQGTAFAHNYVPISQIGASFTLPMYGTLDCPNFIRIQHCQTTYEGTLQFERTDTYVRGEPDPAAPAEPAIPVPPVDASDAALEAFYLQIAARMAREDKYAQAVVRCGKPCEGGVSAYAIALSKQGTPKGLATKLGRTSFRSAADGTGTVTVPLSKADRALAKRRGGIELRTEATPVGGGKTVRSSTTLRIKR